MKIEDTMMVGLLGSAPAFKPDNDLTDGSFSGYLEEETARIEGILAGLGREEEPVTGDIASIKKKGLVAYIMELHEKRLREEILASMGLTEEDLGKMSPEQRAAIEKAIAEEIQKRMAAEAMMGNKEDDKAGSPKLEEMMMPICPVSILELHESETTELSAKRQENEEE
ncbi:MAG: hypothetical protein NDI81_04455 [Desulfobacula sp.]|nr:hypothetical protein [Desulfobacula sp.]